MSKELDQRLAARGIPTRDGHVYSVVRLTLEQLREQIYGDEPLTVQRGQVITELGPGELRELGLWHEASEAQQQQRQQQQQRTQQRKEIEAS